MIPVGAINTADSLAAIKQVVFETKRIALKELKQALDANWEGNDDIRRLCLNAPKYGNDNDYADSIAADLYNFLIDVESNYRSFGRPANAKVRGIGGASISPCLQGARLSGQPLTAGMPEQHYLMEQYRRPRAWT
jgi:formate C-acetyltransferase